MASSDTFCLAALSAAEVDEDCIEDRASVPAVHDELDAAWGFAAALIVARSPAPELSQHVVEICIILLLALLLVLWHPA
jgi:hypothetical protein